MFTDMFLKLWNNHIFLWGIWQTVYMTVISTAFAYLLGLPLGLVLSVTDKDGIRPRPAVNKTLGVIVNAFRSVPFIILMVALLPVAKLIVGTSIGNKAVIVTLVVGAAPYVARMVESSIKEVDKGVIEAAEAMGTPTFKIITKVLIAEAKPSLITGAVISMVTILGYSAMAATLGGTGLGQVAVVYGHQRFNQDVIWFSALLCVLIVQVIQEVGMRIVHKTDKRISN